MIRYNTIRSMDVSNGPGARVSLFMQGCDKHCKGCFNSETWDPNKGKVFDLNTISKIQELMKSEHINGLSILGGDFFYYYKHPEYKGEVSLLTHFLSKTKSLLNKSIWIWTGYDFYKDLITDPIIEEAISDTVDVIIDGMFIQEEYDPNIPYAGSRNQRAISVKEQKEFDQNYYQKTGILKFK